jgi:hypothetical protein
MKYKVLEISNTDFDIITEDGGLVSVHYNGDNYISDYYQTRLTEIDPDEDLWEQMGEGKIYHKDWNPEANKEEMILDALKWLVVSKEPINWEIDNNLFNKILN